MLSYADFWLLQRKSSSGRTMLGVALNGDASQKYSLSQSDDDDDNTRADGEDEGQSKSKSVKRKLPFMTCSATLATDTRTCLLP